MRSCSGYRGNLKAAFHFAAPSPVAGFASRKEGVMAFITRTEAMVRAGRTAEYEARQAQFYELQKTQPGFVRAMLLNSLGYPAKYTSLVVWGSREAYRAWARSEARSSFFQA